MTAIPAPRSVAVELLSIREELANIVRLGTTIVLAVWLYLASALGEGGAARRHLLPYQTVAQNRPAVEQRMFRELQEGLLEAETAKSTGGNWPTTELLAIDGIPPFAPDPTSKTVRYQWRMLRDGTYIVNYLGIPDRPDAPAWLLLIQEPEPGVLPDQANEDEEHHRLLDGTMLHVSTWSHTNGSDVPARAIRMPQVEGWTQIYAVGPGTLGVTSSPPGTAR